MILLMLMSVTCAWAGGAAKDDESNEKVSVIVGFNDDVKRADQSRIIGDHEGAIKKSYTLINAATANVPGHKIDALKKNRNVKYVEEDIRIQVIEEVQTLPWGVGRIDAELVHPYNKGYGIKVAIIDTGIDYDHPDLDDNYVTGKDFANNDDDPMDGGGHGTHCAGIIAAEDNGIGVIGVAPEAKLYIAKSLFDDGSAYISDIVEGIQWAVDKDVDVISMSLGINQDYQSWHDACDAADTAGIVVVAAAGNDGNLRGRGDNVDYPARYGSVIAVAATDRYDNRAWWSSTGPDVELAAPGVEINSTIIGGYYGTKSGTSMACPHVAGTAALVLLSDETAWTSLGYTDGDSTWTNAEVRTVLDNTADDLGTAGKDEKYGYGLVDADEAAPPPVGNRAPVANAGPDQDVKTGSTVYLDGTGSYDPDDDSITYSWAFVSKPADSTTLSGADTATPTFVADTDGSYEVELTVSDGGLSSTDSVVITAAPAPSEPTTVSVKSISYRTEGGRNQDKHLLITVALIDDLDNPIAGASVSIDVDRDGSDYGSDTGTTGTSGTVTFQTNNAPSGTYTTTVTDVIAGGLTWDDDTPDNSFDKW